MIEQLYEIVIRSGVVVRSVITITSTLASVVVVGESAIVVVIGTIVVDIIVVSFGVVRTFVISPRVATTIKVGMEVSTTMGWIGSFAQIVIVVDMGMVGVAHNFMGVVHTVRTVDEEVRRLALVPSLDLTNRHSVASNIAIEAGTGRMERV